MTKTVDKTTCPVARKECEVPRAALATLWPIEQLTVYPDNPRTVRTDSPAFLDLKASIEANGILEPLTVRHHGVGRRQVLSGHRRLAAAKALGKTQVPIRDLGEIDDALAFDIVAIANLHEDLTPLEEGKRAALWLDKYGQDAEAVASKLGKTVRWVTEHAHIHRNLSAEWQAFAASNDQVQCWTASHWAVIAKLPLVFQAKELGKFRNSYCSYDRWSVRELADRVALKENLLAQAPFDVATCEGCMDRTDVQPLLWNDKPEQATGKKARCLNAECWQKKATKAQRAAFKTLAKDKGQPDAVPVCLLTDPGWRKYREHGAYNKRLVELRKVHRGLLTADKVTVVKEGTKGAVPAIVVAGQRGRKGITWVKIKEEKKVTSTRPSPAQQEKDARKQEAEKRRQDERDAVVRTAVARLIDGEVPEWDILMFLSVGVVASDLLWGRELDEFLKSARGKDRPAFAAWLRQAVWQIIVTDLRNGLSFLGEADVGKGLEIVCPLVGIDLEEIRKELSVAKAKPGPGVCRVCGCTDDNCSQCVEKTGEPCYWVEPDLCSACATPEQLKAFAEKAGAKSSKGKKRAKKKGIDAGTPAAGQ